MKPKFSYKTKAEVPTALSEFYTEKDGVWYLDVDGAADAERLKEFRDNNIDLKKQVKDLTEKFADIDPVEHKKLVAKAATLEAAVAKADGKIDELIATRTEAMKKEHEKTVANLTKNLEGANNELSRLKIDSAVLEAGTKHGLRSTAHLDLIARAQRTFKLGDDGKIVATGPDGKAIYGKGADPLTIGEWVESQAKEAAHLFEPSQGGNSQGGAGGGGGGGGKGGGVNPWKQGSVNLTEQGKLVRADPALAVRMAAEAGVKLALPTK